jgi:formylglycine-generating enzyme required for sulfatase activity
MNAKQIKQINLCISAILFATLAATARADSIADLNGDGCVDLDDFAIFQQEYTGPACEVASFIVMNTVPAGGAGPDYTFDMSRDLITVSQFVTFINDAQANPANERGSNLDFQPNGDVGLPAGASNAVFDISDNTHEFFDNGIAYNDAAALGDRYTFDPARATHPIVGVTWTGAAKFCNWLTIDQGFKASQRAYAEGPAAADWRPVTITSKAWSTRDLNDAERQSLVDNIRGFRLPMDNVGTIIGFLDQQENIYNEWYKAAAFDPRAPDTFREGPGGEIISPDHWIYGFGRDTISGSDANFFASGDSFDDGTTPVGFYNGVNPGTNASANRFGLSDMSGNVWQWTQDYAADRTFHALRGGSWDFDFGDFLAVSDRGLLPTGASEPITGFRVLRVPDPN